jgi:hypothetical protein
MPKLITNGFLKDILDQYFVNNNVEILLVMNTSTAPTERDGITFVNNYTLLDECDGTGYVRKTLSEKTSSADDANDQAAFDFEDITWLLLGNGTRPLVGLLLIRKVIDDTDSPAGIFLPFPAETDPGGGDFTVRIPVGGAILAKQTVVV